MYKVSYVLSLRFSFHIAYIHAHVKRLGSIMQLLSVSALCMVQVGVPEQTLGWDWLYKMNPLNFHEYPLLP